MSLPVQNSECQGSGQSTGRGLDGIRCHCRRKAIWYHHHLCFCMTTGRPGAGFRNSSTEQRAWGSPFSTTSRQLRTRNYTQTREPARPLTAPGAGLGRRPCPASDKLQSFGKGDKRSRLETKKQNQKQNVPSVTTRSQPDAALTEQQSPLLTASLRQGARWCKNNYPTGQWAFGL